MRPQTAESNQLKSSAPKKFKMLKELARLNQELRVQKPYAPSEKEKKIIEQNRSWSAQRSGNFLKKGGGVGGGNIPQMDIIKE